MTLEIAGTKFRLVADTEQSHLQELAATVNERVAKLGAASKSASTAQLLALVALGLADDLKSCEKKLLEVDLLARNTISSVIARIDTRLSEDLAHDTQGDPAAD